METVGQRVFTVEQAAFSGGLPELLTELRSGRLPPGALDLVALVRDWLAFFAEHWQKDMESATEALPLVAQVLELKLRLLVGGPPADGEDAAEEELVGTVAELVNLENAILYLSGRREERRLLLPARASMPPLPRPERPLGLRPGRLAELAGRLRSTGYFEVVRSGFGFRQARELLLSLLRRAPRLRFSEVRQAGDWARTTVLFAALLELVRQGSVRAVQAEPGGDITMIRAGTALLPGSEHD